MFMGRINRKLMAFWLPLLVLTVLTGSIFQAGQITEETEEAGAVESTRADGSEKETEDTVSMQDKEPAAQEVQVRRIHYAQTREEIFDAIKDLQWYLIDYALDYDVMMEMAAEEDMAFSSAVPSEATAINADSSAAREETIPEYSDTNVRTEGVDEADIVKTDGKYLYILHDSQELLIVRADGADTELVSRTNVFSRRQTWWYTNAGELFISDGKACIISSEENDLREDAYYWNRHGYNDQKTCLKFYDVSNPENPRLESTLEVEGAYEQARMKDGKIYLFTKWEPDVRDTCNESILLPYVGEDELPVGNVILPDVVTDSTYLIMTAASFEVPDQWSDTAALVSGAGLLYVSSDNIYAVNVKSESSRDKSEIIKIRYGNGAFTGIAAGTVSGIVDDSFSLDEYKGNLRVLTSYWGTLNKNLFELFSDLFGLDYYNDQQWVRHNALYVLGEDMRRVGRIADIAEGEEIKSARFFGDTAYFVTFERTDPLFTADLSDPRSPRIIGELKLPGFSAYLHPFGENRILGLGYDADEDTGVTTGLKISLYDTTDPVKVKEIARRVLPGITWCPAVDEYKAIFADGSRELVGFWCSDRYLVFAPDGEESFDLLLLYDFLADDLMGDSDYSSMRGLYIGNEFYLAGTSFVLAFDMENDFRKDCVLKIE